MRRSKLDVILSLSRQRSLQFLLAMVLLYVVVVFFFEFPFLSRWITGGGEVIGGGDAMTRVLPLDSEEATEEKSAPARPSKGSIRLPQSSGPIRPPPPADRWRRLGSLIVSGLNFVELNATGRRSISELHKSARDAWEVGSKLLIELKSAPLLPPLAWSVENRTDESCRHSIVLTGAEFRERGGVMVLPCGLTLGSHITLVAQPYRAHREYDPKITILREGDQPIMVSQFMMELQGLKTVDGEDPPRILHFNPRLKGDWSGKPVIEQNTCYRMQWGAAQRCEGWKSRADEETGTLVKLFAFSVFLNPITEFCFILRTELSDF